MRITEQRRKTIFSLLDELASLPMKDLVKEFSGYDESIMCDLAAELFGEDKSCKYKTAEEFADCIYKMKENKRKWSRKIGHMLIVADNLLHKNEMLSAIEYINSFISSCEVPYFRLMAEQERNKLHNQMCDS